MRVLLAALAVVLLVLPTRAQGVLTFETTSHDFGELELGPAATQVFRFTNTGTQPLALTAVRTSCGCTAPHWSQDPVAPGATGEIAVEYDTKDRPGPFERTITVVSNDAEPSSVVLTIQGFVRASELTNGPLQGNLMFDADQYTFEQPVAGTATHIFQVQNKGQRPIRITGAQVFGAEGVTVDVPNGPVFAGDLVRITVAFDAATLPRDAFDLAVVLTTDDAAQPRKSLRLSGLRAVAQ